MNKSARPPESPAPRGRRPGRSDSRERILEVAAGQFLESGYQATSLRAIATGAGVDVALVSYFFGSKQGLFSAAMALTVSPFDVLTAALDGPLDGLAERVLRGTLEAWDDPASGAPLRAVLRAAATQPDTARLVREAIQGELVGGLSARLGGDAAAHRRAAAFSISMAGLVFGRYLLALEPLASMPPDDVVDVLLPSMRAALGQPVSPAS